MLSCNLIEERYDVLINFDEESIMSVSKINPLTFDEVSKALAYNPATGEFRWRVNAARNVKAGDLAGTKKGARFSKSLDREVAYVYIRLNNVETPAARVAWLLQNGSWPDGNILFRDGDTENLRFDNLREALVMRTHQQGELKVRKLSKDAQRHYGLKRYYGMTGEEYGEMLAAQKGLCAICGKPETAMLNGVPKVMHVDHCHETDQVRALLCGSCNGMLGLAKDSPETLRAAADYIEKHRERLA